MTVSQKCMRQLIIIISFFALYAVLAIPALAVNANMAWQQNFEHGTGGAQTYYHSRGGAQAKLQIIKGSAAAGNYYLQAKLPGQRSLEGFSVIARKLAGGRMTTVSAKVRGSGKMFIALSAGGSWVYSRHVRLTNNWQTLKVARTMRPSDHSMRIYFLRPGKPTPGTVFDVDDIKVTQAAPMQLYNTAVGPRRLSAADFAAPKYVITNSAAEKIVSSKRALRLSGLPFPRTSLPVTVYLHVKGASSRFRLQTRAAGPLQTIHTTTSSKTDNWQWIQFKPVLAPEVGSQSLIEARPSKGKTVAIDQVVISTNSHLSKHRLQNAQPLLPSPPVAVAARSTHPPVIDGKGDDACWQHTVAIKDFILFGSHMPAPQSTTVRLAYDNKNLYVLVRCTEPLLKVVDQRESEIVAKAKQRDGKVLKDDSFLMFIQPHPKKQPVYEFTVNTIGTLLDAKEKRKNLWRSRNIKWNSNAKVAVKRYNGYWTQEMSIPLANLGVNKIQPGARWRIGLDRVARSRGQYSSWQPTASAGAHAPVALGILNFAPGPVGMTPAHGLTQLEPGENSISFKLGQNAVAKGINMTTALKGQKTHSRQTTFAAQPGEAKHTVTVEQQGSVTARRVILSAGSLKPVYISPKLDLTVRSSRVGLQVTAPGQYTVKVNQRQIASGNSAKNKLISIPLKKGKNIITVQSQDGAAQLQLKAPWAKRFNHAWQISKDKQGKMIIYSRTVLVDYTNVWPVPKPAWYIAGGGTQHINFTMMGIKDTPLKHWITYLAVPKGLKVLGATDYYGKLAKPQPVVHCTPAGKVTIGGQSLPLYKIAADRPIRTGRASIMNFFQVYLKIANPVKAQKGTSWKLYYWSQANGGKTIEPPRSFEMKALSPLAGVQPKQFILQLWRGVGRMYNDKIRNSVLATAAAAGFNSLDDSSAWSTKAAKKYNIKVQGRLSFNSWSIDLTTYLAKHPGAKLTNYQGWHSKRTMCPTLLLGKDWPVVAKAIDKTIKHLGDPSIVIYDFEQPPLTGQHACYDQRCLAAFRKHAHLAKDIKLTPAIIKASYADQWADFMAWRTAEMFAKMKQAVHKASPGTKFAVYSGYQTKYTITHYGIDWRYIGQLHAVDLAGVGYGRSPKRIRDTIAALKGIPLMLGVLLTPYKAKDLRPGRASTSAVILRRALDATGGVLVYERDTMDGRSWKGVAAISRLISKYENLFVGRGINDLKTIPGQDPAAVSIRSGKNISLVCVMNGSSKPRTFRFKLPVKLGEGHAFYSGEKVKAGAAVDRTLLAGGVAVYVLRS